MRDVLYRTFYIHVIFLHVKIHMLGPNSLSVTTFKVKANCGFYVAVMSFNIQQNNLPELIM